MFKETLYWIFSVFVTIYDLAKPKRRRKCRSEARLDGDTVVVTGSNTGIGKETALDFYRRGARVIMACRNLEKATQSKGDIEMLCKDIKHGTLVVEELDISSFKSIREFASRINDREKNLTILVNNAGVMMCPEGRTEDGFEIQFGSNHLGHFMLTLLLLPKLIETKKARIVTVSSIAHVLLCRSMLDDLNWRKYRYERLQAYALSKAANIAMSRELSKRLRDNNIIHVNTYSLHPGVINTELSRHILDSAPYLTWLYNSVCRLIMKTPTQGAQTTIYCAVDEECAKESGLYYSDLQVSRVCGYANNNRWATELWNKSLEMVKLQEYNPFRKP